MQLTFLGTCYVTNYSPIFVVASRIGGKYRSRYWLKNHLKESLLPQSYNRLKYRGASYMATVYSRTSKTIVNVASKPTSERTDSTFINRTTKQ